jgi:hypothetical protein
MTATCHHTHTGLIVHCYHDGEPMWIEPACEDCGMRAEHVPEYEWERSSYFMPLEAGKLARVMALYSTGDYYVNEALDEA